MHINIHVFKLATFRSIQPPRSPPPAGVRSNGNQAHVAPRHSEVTNEISLTAKVAYLQT